MSNDTTRSDQPDGRDDETTRIETSAIETSAIETAKVEDTTVMGRADATTVLPASEPAAPQAPFWDPTTEPDHGEKDQDVPDRGVADRAPDPGPDRASDRAPGQAPDPYAVADERPAAPTGPHLPAIVLSLLLLAVAGLAVADAQLSLEIDWNVTGPIGVLAVGGALVILGALGLAGNRRKR